MKTIYKKLLLLLLLLPLSVLAQSDLGGTVVDKTTNEPLPGVNVVVKGATAGTQTDLDGKFQLKNVKKGDVIVFSYVGYQDSEVTYNSEASLTVSLAENNNVLNEVVLIGYGTAKQKDVTGAVVTVGQKDFNKGLVASPEGLLSGRVAGVNMITGGSPGSGSQIRIRGGSSLAASNDPLIVVDGMPISNDATTGSTSFLSSFNPNDILSFTVLKDASATAIYGSRAANGVIIITTKKGGKKLAVDYNFQYGSGTLNKTLDVFSGDEFRNLINTQYPVGPEFSDGQNTANAKIRGLLGDANTDWQDEIYRRTDYVDNNISLRGNLLNIIPTRISFGNTYQEGLRLTNTFNRNTASAAFNPTFLNNTLKINVNVNYSNQKNRFADAVEGSAIIFDPTQPVYEAGSPYGGYFEYYNPPTWVGGPPSLQLAPRNPVAQLMQTNDTGVSKRFFGNASVDYTMPFLPELRAVVNVGTDQINGDRTRLVPTTAASGPSNNNIVYGTNEYSETTAKNSLFDGYLNYVKLFGKFNVDVTAGYSYQKFEGQTFYTRNTKQPSYNTIGSETDINTDVVLIGYFARAALTFDENYILNLSWRRDGSSRFAENNRWGNFPAAAFAWNMRNVLINDSKTISDLKLRVGYGVTGQQAIPQANVYNQNYVTGDNVSQYIFGNTPYPIAVSTYYNTNIRWEETTSYNIGVDYGFLDNRFYGSLDVYSKESNDLFQTAPVPDGSNFSNRGIQNVGSFTTKGIEFSINADVVKTADFNLNLNFNVAHFEREITELANNSNIYLGDAGVGTGSTAQIFSEGWAPYSFYVYKQLYNSANQPVEGAYADLNGDGIINGNDRYIYKNPDPAATFGFATNMNYKNWDFSFNLRASVGNHVYNAVDAGRAQYDNLLQNQALGNIPSQVLDTNFNTTADVYLSDLYVENASFLRMDNITLGYTFENWLKSGNSSVRVFTGLQNAFVITDYSGLDPEVFDNGMDKTIYPRQQSILFGFNLKF